MYGDDGGAGKPPPSPVRRLAAAALLVLTAARSAPAGLVCPVGPVTIPVVPGTAWVYAGPVRSTVERDGDFVDPRMTLRMEVRKAFRRGDTTAALVDGHPHDLAWYEPGRGRHRYLLLQRDDGTVTVVGSDPMGHLRRWLESGAAPDVSPDVLSPLRVGATWGADPDAPPREDKWYQWHVEAARCVVVRPAGRRLRREYRLGYWTCPDHVLAYWSPGLGITRWVYSHHGTVAEVDVRLVAFESAPSGATGRVRQVRIRTSTRRHRSQDDDLEERSECVDSEVADVMHPPGEDPLQQIVPAADDGP